LDARQATGSGREALTDWSWRDHRVTSTDRKDGAQSLTVRVCCNTLAARMQPGGSRVAAMNVTRKAIFEQAAKKIRTDFEALTTVPHNALKGSEAERLVRQFLNNHLPKRFCAGAGFIIDSQERISKQTDVVIYDAINCPVYRASEEAGIFPSDNVAAVVEVKSRLTKAELRDGFEKIANVKRLSKTPLSHYRLGSPSLVQTMGCVLAFTSELTLETTQQEYGALIKEFDLGFHPDVVAVLDRGMITLVNHARGTVGWAPILAYEGIHGSAAEGAYIGVGSNELGESTLDHFLRLVLMYLTYFREIVAHPGFDWHAGAKGERISVTPLKAVTLETDPQLREQKLKQYDEELLAQMQRSSVDVKPP
jgi:hypothetical protein